MYEKRPVMHIGFGEGDDGWRVIKINEDDKSEDVVAEVQTETLADAIINFGPVLEGLKRAIAALNSKTNFKLPGGGTSYELLSDLDRLVKGAT